MLLDGGNPNLLFEDIAKEKLVGICNGSLSSAAPYSSVISPIDLAAGYGREEILQVKTWKSDFIKSLIFRLYWFMQMLARWRVTCGTASSPILPRC